MRDTTAALACVTAIAAGYLVGYATSARAVRSSSTNNTKDPAVLSEGVQVVNIDDGKLIIKEVTGNASTGDRGISIARVTVKGKMEEAVQIPGFDEYVMVLKGRMIVYVGDNEDVVLEAGEGQTLHLPRGVRYRYTVPEEGCEYVPICLPAFRPEIAGRIG